MVQARMANMSNRKRLTKPPRTPRQAAARRGELERLLDPDFFKALSDPVRVRLLACVAKCARGCSVGEVAQCSHLDFSTVSRHLKTLARAGLMRSSKQGTSVLYAVRYEHLREVFQGLATAIAECSPSKTSKANQGDCNDCC